MRVALCQIASGTDPAANLDLVTEYAGRSAALGAELVVFPEAAMSSFARPRIEVAEPLDGPWATAVRALAERLGLVIVVGMFTPGRQPGRVRNTLLVTGPGVAAHYDKLHLFDAYGYAESEQVEAGGEVVTVDVRGARIGLATCYDIRFPELFKELARLGAELIVVPSSWAPGPGKVRQWRALAAARALDSTSLVIAVGQARPSPTATAGSGRRPPGVGHPLVVSPLCEILAELGRRPELAVVEVDLGRVAQARSTLPVLANSRFVSTLATAGPARS